MRAIVVMLLGFFLYTASASANDADAPAIRSVIEGQLEAFKRGDASAAYGYAAPNIHLLFPDSETFMRMVEQGYPPVYHPRRYTFGALKEQEGATLQSVEIEDGSGQLWTAVYSMEKQADGSWQINGCYLLKSPTTGA